MFGQIAQAIAKIYGENEQTKRNAVNTVSKTATSAGDGSNGQNYQVSSGTDKPTETNTPQPKEQDMSANETLAQTMKNAQPNFSVSAPKTDDDKTDEEDEQSDNSSSLMGGGMDAMSDERLKNIFGNNEDAIKAFAKINAIKFTYNDKAHEIHPNGEHQVDNDVHYGVKAQDLAKNPFTASTVETDEKGYMAVNTPELTMANSAVISELCKRLEIIEKVLGIKVV